MFQAPSLRTRRSLVHIACALGIVASTTLGVRTVAAGVSVVVDGRPLSLKPGPIERAGRVFVPLRGIFERLGASVVYQNRQINSTKGSTSVSLRIGSRQATVNGQPQIVDVAPFIVGATTYVPLRFIAQSLGAVVNYNGVSRLVAITVPRSQLPPPPPVPNPPPVSVVTLRARQPAPDTLTGNRFTPIAAQFSHEVDVDSVRVRLDATDITSRSGVSPVGFSYKPPAPLDFGTHTVRVAGLDRAGLRFAQSWSFTTTRPAPAPESPVQLRGQEPSPGATVNNRFAAIAADFTPQADAASVRVRLDGNDITFRSSVSQVGFSYKPPAPLELGTHTVRVTGRGRTGLAFDRSWSFTTAPSPENPVQLRDQRPSPGATVDNRFAVIAATFTPQAEAASVRVRLDGNDITFRSGVSAGGFSYKPPAPLDFGTHTVRVTGRGRAGLAFDRSWSFTTARAPSPSPSPTPEPVQLRDQRPSPGATVDNRFVEVAANFTPQADAASVRVRLDGNDVTSRSGVSAAGFSYKPPAPLDIGSHRVRVTGRGRAGLPFDRSWSFTVRGAGPRPISVTIRLPDENASVERSFDVAGSTVPNASIRVTAGAGQSGTGQFSGTTTAGQRGNFSISVTLATLLGQQTVTVKITATDPSSSQTAEKTLRLRLKHAAPTPEPMPSPTRKPRVVPTIAPTPVPTVAPTRAPRVVPTIAPTPVPTVAPTRAPRVVPTIAPTPAPTVAPTRAPRVVPTIAPTPAPTVAPTRPRKVAPTASPSATPTALP